MLRTPPLRVFLALFCFFLSAVGCVSEPPPPPPPPPAPAALTAVSVSAFGCQFPFGTNCFWGEGQLPGCSNSCRYANVPEIPLDFTFRITGLLTQPEEAGPLSGFPVYVLLPDNTKYLGRTDETGYFSIAAEPGGGGGKAVAGAFAYDFGELVTVPEAGAFAIVVEPTPEFRETYPEVQVREVEVASFDGQTVELE